jgi:hypothetical protein
MKKNIVVLFLCLLMTIGTPSFANNVNLSDTESPKIDRVSLSNQNIEVSQVSSDLLVTITASDNLNNVSTVFLAIYRSATPFPTQVNLFPTITSTQPISTSVVNNRVISVFQIRVTIPKGLASGEYYIWTFARDAAGNFPQTGSCDKYCNVSELPNIAESKFSIKNDSTGQVIDVTKFDLTTQLKTLQTEYDSLSVAHKNLKTDYEIISAAKIKLENDSKSLIILANEAEAKLRTSEEARKLSEGEVSRMTTEKITINKDYQLLKAKLSAMNKKIASVCKVKPKPKGC